MVLTSLEHKPYRGSIWRWMGLLKLFHVYFSDTLCFRLALDLQRNHEDSPESSSIARRVSPIVDILC